jgi:hypothetical protein
VSCLNAACVWFVNSLCLVSILPMFLVCPFYVLSQCCPCTIETRHKMDKPETQAVLGQDT